MIFYSKTTNAFYLFDSKENYETAGTWPDDAINISLDIFNEFSGTPPDGKRRIAGRDGLPAWGDIPPLTYEQVMEIANAERTEKLAEASVIITPLQDAIDLDMATDEEKRLYNEWRKYRVLLNRIDASKYPDIEWPPLPK
ncbi:tail fiber assembly protein [Limnobaculum xujianqingii]|uniref:tail fiber assembly protein n=1 Tax=Limnobaculum xujianqingii TaxID=2738837 RepID=UPI00112B8BCD|nr:tail fiber assembly protein [Limnobaculum xujianqingii]